MLHPASDLRAAARAQLLAQSDITSAVSGVFETAPAKSGYPYITLGDERVRDWSTQTFRGEEHTLLLNTWSDAESFAPLKDLHRLVRTYLSSDQLALTDHHLAVFFCEEERFLIERRRRARLGVLRFRALMHPTALAVPA
ncbi:MAG: DUF3168 domain-containing protein [Pseudomonadota bacterium]